MKQHFLYNTLNTIKFLITEDAEKAETAIVKFSEYLRQNMNALSNGNFILFEQELRHIENYVYVEKLRFDDRLRVHYNVKTRDFFVPSLSIQPLVENAIKHGITKKLDGGDVWIDVYHQDNSFVVEIKDNGVGFDTRILDTASPSVAIKNIRDRINIIDGASFTIESKVNEGTKCVITIPENLPQNLEFFVKESLEFL
jgi:sensor histidine kinase YesM